MDSHSSRAARSFRGLLSRRFLSCAVVLAALLILAVPAVALAGQASSGELFFYPCTSCHPIRFVPSTQKPIGPLPNNFQGHQIVLQGHDVLGVGNKACLVCHDDPTRNPGMLKLADGSLIDINGDTALVCYRCHSTKYKEWKAGTHGKHKDKCTAAGCHDPHTPQYIYAGPTMPFIGTGWQFQVLSKRVPFMALMSPAPSPPVTIPGWFVGLAVVGLVAAGGLGGTLLVGRFKR